MWSYRVDVAVSTLSIECINLAELSTTYLWTDKTKKFIPNYGVTKNSETCIHFDSGKLASSKKTKYMQLHTQLLKYATSQ